jgi:hypothetical protein
MTKFIHPSKRAKFKGRTGQSFLALPSDLLAHPAFVTLSNKSKALLLDLGQQYNGHNNGDLTITWCLMSKRNWRSKQTLRAALEELMARGFVQRTRRGGRFWPSLYAITWQPIDECGGKLEVNSTRVAGRDWRHWSPPASPISCKMQPD